MQLYTAALKLPQIRGRGVIIRALQPALIPKPYTVGGEVKMYLDPVEWSQAQLLEGKETEPETIKLLKRLLNVGDTYVDVGAHVGYHSLIARTAIGPTGRVIAIEPQPYNCARLLANWRVNDFDNLFIFAGLAGSKNEITVPLAVQQELDTSRLSVVLRPVYDEQRKFAVSMTRLDFLF